MDESQMQCNIPNNELSGVLKLWMNIKSTLLYILPLLFPFILYRHLGSSATVERRRFLKGQVVLITGASSGLGEALAHSFYNAGCKVILAARRIEELNRVKNSIISSSETSGKYPPTVLQIDLTDLGSICEQANKGLALHGHIDILVNNAGISHRGGVLHTNTEVDIKIMTVNYFGQIALTKALLPGMVSRRRGHIVAISSVQGLIGIPYRSAYAASKHALQGFCDSLRAEMAEHGVKVTVISPGYIRTQLSANALTADGHPHGVTDAATAEGYSPEDVAQQVIDAVVAGTPEKIISTVTPRLAIFCRHFLPFLYFRIMEKRAKAIHKELSSQ